MTDTTQLTLDKFIELLTDKANSIYDDFEGNLPKTKDKNIVDELNISNNFLISSYSHRLKNINNSDILKSANNIVTSLNHQLIVHRDKTSEN